MQISQFRMARSDDKNAAVTNQKTNSRDKKHKISATKTNRRPDKEYLTVQILTREAVMSPDALKKTSQTYQTQIKCLNGYKNDGCSTCDKRSTRISPEMTEMTFDIKIQNMQQLHCLVYHDNFCFRRCNVTFCVSSNQRQRPKFGRSTQTSKLLKGFVSGLPFLFSPSP